MDLAAPDFYLLRWRFDFKDAPTALGMWSQDGDIAGSGAWKFGMKEGIVRASIEGKHVVTRQTITLAECDGHDFVVFLWLAAAKINPFSIRGKGTTPPSTCLGLSLVSRELITEVLVTGVVTATLRPDAHRRIGFATYGK